MPQDEPEFSELVQDVDLELLILVGHESELGHEGGRVRVGVVVTELSCA